jgi:NCS1 family nucleobase:cation symporter-1
VTPYGVNGTPYGANIAVVEPHGIERIDESERHGSPRDLFSLWFAANAETATFAVGILTVALFGTSFWGAILGIVIGNLAGYAVLGFLAQMGPRFGRPQMMVSRQALGTDANVFPSVLAFLAGVGWFAIDTIFGAFAVQALFGLAHISLAYIPALAIVLAIEIAIVIYGYNMIHLFEKIAGVVLTIGFVAIAIACFQRANAGAPFDAHAPLASGGEIAGIVFSAALAFSYAIGWAPCAADYSRYLPAGADRRAVWWWTFLGGGIPSTGLEILGAAAVTAIVGTDLVAATPSDIIAKLFASNWLVSLGLLTVLLGTLSANCLNLYSGSLASLVAWDARRRPWFAILVGATFALGAVVMLTLAGQADPSARFAPAVIAVSALTVGVVTGLVVRYTLVRWQAALLVGVLGGVLSLAGLYPAEVAREYTNFLLLLSSWATPWAGAVIASRGMSSTSRYPPALIAWIAGFVAALPFYQQAWFVGPIAAHFPMIGDVSYFVGFGVAFVVARVLASQAKPQAARA